MKRIALIGAKGMLAAAIRKLAPADYVIQPYDLPEFDLSDPEQVNSLRAEAADIIINCAAFTKVDECETQQELAMRVNGAGPGLLAELARQTGAVLLQISTDFVFSGDKSSPYLEEDAPSPLSIYGKSKLVGELRIQQTGLEKYYILRTSWLYGAGGNNFVETMIRLAKERTELKVVSDQRGTPTWTEDLAKAIFVLLRSDSYGIYHYSNDGECSWHEFACEIINQIRFVEALQVKKVQPIPTEGYPLPAARPKFSVLSKEKIKQVTGLEIPAWQQSLKSYLIQR